MQSLTSPDLTRDPQPADTLILWMPVFLAGGIGAYYKWPFEPPVWISAVLLGLALALIAATRHWRDYVSWRWAMAMIVLFSMGLGLAQWETHRTHTPLLTHRYWNADISGTVDSFERMGAGWRVFLKDVKIEEDTQIYRLRISVRMRGFVPALGDKVQLKGSLMPPSPPLIPGSYDFQRHAFFKNISGYGYATKVVLHEPSEEKASHETLENYRDWLTEKVYAQLKQPEAGVVTAMLNGQRAGITRKTTENMQQSGLQHVISISGLHVGLLAATVFYITRLLMALSMTVALHFPIKKIAAGFAMTSIIFYMLIVGLSPPTVRAVLMTGVALLAVMLDRDPIQLRVVSLAALFLLIIQPYSILDIGFQMSFAAVIGLVSFYQWTRYVWSHEAWRRNIVMKGMRALLMVVATSIVATAVTAPLVLYYFQQVPLLSMLSNILATPMITFMIMPGTFLSYVFTPLPLLGDWAIRFMGLGVTGMLLISDWVAKIPASVWRAPALPFSAMLLCMGGIFILIVMKGRMRLIGCIPICFAVIMSLYTTKPDIVLTHERVVILNPADEDHLIVDGRVGKFEKNLFKQRFGKENVVMNICDTDICDKNINGQTVRFIRSVPALDHACHGPKTDIIVAPFYLDDRCKGSYIIDRRALNRSSSQSVFVGDVVHTTTGWAAYNRRPWQQVRRYPRKKLDFKRKGGYTRNIKNIHVTKKDAL